MKKEELIELSEEEIQEELEDSSARVIQRAFRQYEARTLVQSMVRQNYVKLRDREKNIFVYKNKTTGEVRNEKPLLLGEKDLKTPRNFVAPDDYRPGYRESEGYALIVTVTSFSNGRIEDFTKHTEADQGLLEHFLSHEFICKFPAENVIPLLNPTLSMFKDALGRLRRMCKKKSFLFIYISTHVATVMSRLKEFRGEDCFLLFKDTVWRSSDLAAQTSMPLFSFASSLNNILAERKVVALNMCHNKPPQKSIFKSRYFYPPPDCLTRLADMANCAVLSSCSFGSQIPSLKEHMPSSLNDAISSLSIDNKKGNGADHHEDSVQDSKVASMEEVLPSSNKNTSTLYNSDIITSYQKEWLKDLNLKPIVAPKKPQRPTLRWKKIQVEAAPDEAKPETEENNDEKKESDHVDKAAKKDIFSKRRKKVKKASVVKSEENPDEDGPKKVIKEKTIDEKDEEAGQELGIQVAMPSKSDFISYSASMKIYRMKKTFFPIIRAYRSRYNTHKLASGASPRQKTLLTKKKHSLFGRLLIDGMTGNITVRSGNHITVKELFIYLYDNIPRSIKKLTEADDEGLFPRQDPLLLLPKDNMNAADFPVCCVCGPPAAPSPPYVVRLGMNSVLLEWDLLPFDGVGPTKYRIYMRNNTRLYYDWVTAPGCDAIEHIPGESTIRFSVNHLPLGVPTEFCVAAANIGGWSKLSPPSIKATPGENLIPYSLQKTWKIVALGGPLAVLDRLDKFPENRLEHLNGIRFLKVFAQREGAGFSRLNIKEKASSMCMRALKIFPLDDDICAGAFEIIGYCLQGYMYRKLTLGLLKDGLVEQINAHMAQYRNNSRVMNAIVWLNRALPPGKLSFPDQKPLPFASGVNPDEETLIA